jgi:alkylation response protein AidB-like acyl-CoA dehydrogenase
VRDLAIIAEERGRVVQPGPFIPMNVAVATITRIGSPEQKSQILPAIIAGEAMIGWEIADTWGTWAPGESISARRVGNGYVLSGEACLVPYGNMADWVLVTAKESRGLTQFLIPVTTPGLNLRAVEGHDITQRFSSLSLSESEVDSSTIVGFPGKAVESLETQLRLALVLLLAETIGAMDVLFDMARTYSLDRIAFGRPIGSFQAVKHQLADMSLLLEAGKAIACAAVEAVQEERADAGELVSIAKAWVSETGLELAQGCFQVFGGIGYTWEHDMHLFLRRITMNGLLFGQADWHRERICELAGI